MNDETFRKVQRLSYGQHGSEEVLQSPLHNIQHKLSDNNNSLLHNKYTNTLQIGRLGLHGRGTANRSNAKEGAEESVDLRSHNGLNLGNTSEDLAALDRLITYLLSQPNNSGSNLDSWRRSRRASSRGYRQLRGTAADVAETGGVGTTPL